MSDDFLFADENETEQAPELLGSWKIIIVDDEPEVHAVTKLALSDFTFQNKGLEFISAHSGHEAKQVILEHPDAAIVLLDVVMETDDAGLNVAKFIREEAANNNIRIILRTGQPGQAPERQVIVNYDINDYKSKTELTAQKLFTVVMASLRSFRDILSLEQSRKGLEKIILASADLFTIHSMDKFIQGVIQQLTSIIGCNEEALYIVSSLVASSKFEDVQKELVILAGQGEFANYEGQLIKDVVNPGLMEAIEEAYEQHNIVYREDYLVAYCSSKSRRGSLLYISGIPRSISRSHYKLIEMFSQNVQIAYENVQLQIELENTQQELIHRLSEAIEHKSPHTTKHVHRVGEISHFLAIHYGLSQDDAEQLRLAAPLHDVGKSNIPEHILNKTEELTPEEWELIRSHAEVGYNILKESEHNIIRTGAIIARDHHEKWDGTGYPNGKKGTDIHIFGRITALADVYDCLRHKRSYAEAWSLEKTVDFIQNNRGIHFEPKLVDIFLAHISKIEHILQKYPDL